jgi:hypothetical protein
MLVSFPNFTDDLNVFAEMSVLLSEVWGPGFWVILPGLQKERHGSVSGKKHTGYTSMPH